MSAATNQAQFSNAIKRFSEKLKINAGKLQRQVTFDLQKELIERTPVKTGRAAANWHASVGEPSKEVDYDATTPKAQPDLEVDGTRDTFVINNIHYITYLDEGSSQKAPNGMRLLSMMAVQADLEKAVREIEGGRR